MSGKFALIIGNTEYTDPGLAQLTAPGKDTEDFARVLKDQDIGAFDEVNVLLNQPEPVVRGAIDEFFDLKKPDDLLVLYFSGHGVRDELGALYLAVKNTIRTRLRSTAVKSDYIREAMDQSRSRRQVLILDCCNSGAYAQGTKAATGVSIGTASAFEAGYGRIVLTASDSTQFAWEGDKVIGETDNSLFTHYLVQGLEGEADLDGDGRITVDELYDYAYEKVRLATPKQTPSKFSSKQQGEIVLRQSMRIEDIKPVPLPAELIDEIEDTRPYVREIAVQKLEKLLKGRSIGLARSAREALEKIAADDDSRRVSLAATQAIESIRQAEQKVKEEREAAERAAREQAEREAAELKVKEEAERIASQKAEEERLAQARVEAERKAKEEAQLLAAQKTEEERIAMQEVEKERLAQQKVENEQKTKEESERLAAQKAEEERLKKQRAEQKRAARQKAKAELKAREEANRLAAQKSEVKRVARESAERSFAQIRDKLSQLLAYGKVKWDALINYLQSIPKNKSKIYTLSALAIVAVAGFLSYQQLSNDSFYFSGTSDGDITIYFYDGENANIPQGIGEGRNWSPAVGAFGRLYFTSNRDGKAEIYEMKSDGNIRRLTQTPDPWESWSPAFGAFGRLFFTSNRDGKAEIYELKSDGNVERLTRTPDPWESWSPAVDAFGRLYFTSNRDGKAEIYEFKRASVIERLTHTPDPWESWSPAVALSGRLFFTSNRDGKAEIYEFKRDSEIERFTNTPDPWESWSPVIRGQNIYFTSDREGFNRVYALTPQAIAIYQFESWTTRSPERLPNPRP